MHMSKFHEMDYEIHGESIQTVAIDLDPYETVIAEAGVMNYMDQGIKFETKMGDGSSQNEGFIGAVKGIAKRTFARESLFMTHFTNIGDSKAKVAFAAPYTGKIIALDLSNYDNEIFCQKSSFLCAAKGTSISLHINKKIGTGLFGGEGFIMQKLSGYGMVFIHAGGHIQKVELDGDRSLKVDTGCLVATTKGVNVDITRAGGLKTMVFGGEGVFLTELSGKGTVWLQSLPFTRLANTILASAPNFSGSSKG